jgi:hypothetical protein
VLADRPCRVVLLSDPAERKGGAAVRPATAGAAPGSRA